MTNLKFVKLNLHGNNTFQNTSFCEEKKLNRNKVQRRMSNGGTNVHTKMEIELFNK